LKTCFLIDDDEDDREVFQLALHQIDRDFIFICSDDGREAIDKLKNGELNPDYIFLDLNMPLLSGRDCLIEIRKMSKFADVPVMMYTTSSDTNDKEECLKLGANAFITKPNKISELTEILKEILIT
jgi:CheY-like chemotaxis protein